MLALKRVIANIFDEAKRVLKRNSKHGVYRQKGVDREYFYISPSNRKYPHQWLWDSCFQAIVNSKLDPESAKRELKTLLSAVEGDGFLPSIICWGGRREVEMLAWPLFKGRKSRLTQPPVVAMAVEEVFDKTKDREFLKEVLPTLGKYYQWLARERDPDGDGLVSIIHPWESTDDSPAFDKPLLGKSDGRPNRLLVYFSFYKLLIRYSFLGWDQKKILASNLFNVESVMFNCIYAQGLRSLSRLYKAVNQTGAADDYRMKADAVEKAILEKMFDPERELFFDIVHQKGAYEHNLTVTISSLFPIILDTIPKEVVEKLVKNHLANPVEFWLPYPVPFVSKEEAGFNPEDDVLLWRGPVWVNTNWFIWKGLLKHNYRRLADQLAAKTTELVHKSGLREFYNPFTGSGEGQKDYGWSALVVDMVNPQETPETP